MARYSIFVMGESQITLSNGTVLDGVSQGDGSHLIGETLRIDSTDWEEIRINDSGNETNFADNDGGQRLDGTQSLDGVTYGSRSRIEAEYRFILEDPDTGLQYEAIAVNINNSNPAYASVEGLVFVDDIPPVSVDLLVVSAEEGPKNSGAGAVDQSRLVPICFVSGTLIDTPAGPVAVEALRAGDPVLSHDGRIIVLRAAYAQTLDATRLSAEPKLRPVAISAGALGAGLPRRDLLVSRQHRMLITSRIAERMFGSRSVLVPAHRLTGLPGIAPAAVDAAITYVHLVFDRHEVILAEGAPSESLFTGPEALRTIPPEARAELLALFPEIDAPDYEAVPAEIIPAAGQQARLVARHAKNGIPLLKV